MVLIQSHRILVCVHEMWLVCVWLVCVWLVCVCVCVCVCMTGTCKCMYSTAVVVLFFCRVLFSLYSRGYYELFPAKCMNLEEKSDCSLVQASISVEGVFWLKEKIVNENQRRAYQSLIASGLD